MRKILPNELIINNSTCAIGRGPLGDKIASPDVIIPSEEDISQLCKNDFSVAISFHYCGDEWARLNERAIKTVFEEYGVKVIAITDAHFDYKLQIAQLEGLLMQKPDAIISIPADDTKMVPIYKRIAKSTKLILLHNIPDGFTRNDYECCISTNEQENGRNIGRLLIDYFEAKENANIGMITHGSAFFASQQRDFFAEQVMHDSGKLNIVAKSSFNNEEEEYDICLNILKQHSDLDGLYVSWDRPALHAIRALEKTNRTDIVVATSDLDVNIAKYIAKKKIVIGISAQRPYEQGIAVANATIKALLDKTEYKSIGVSPCVVQSDNIKTAWAEILKRSDYEVVVK